METPLWHLIRYILSVLGSTAKAEPHGCFTVVSRGDLRYSVGLLSEYRPEMDGFGTPFLLRDEWIDELPKGRWFVTSPQGIWEFKGNYKVRLSRRKEPYRGEPCCSDCPACQLGVGY